MWWLFVAISSYILLAVASLIDKFLLSGKLSNPKLYAFYVGIFSAGAFLFLPFGIWADPGLKILLIGAAAGAAQIYGCYFYLSALQRFEASRAVPVIGSMVPVFGFFLTFIVSGGTAVLGLKELAGFLLLISGSWLIMSNGISISKASLGGVLSASFLFATSVVLAKLVYMQLPSADGLSATVISGIDISSFLVFLRGFLLMAFGSVLAALTFLISGDVRKTVFGSRAQQASKPSLLFFFGQAMGGSAFLLQNFAVSLAPQASVPVINAMAGIQYVFILVFSLFLSVYLPKSFKEKLAPAAIIQKTIAILMIMAGLAIFALS
jgi:hypothetical protein